MSTLSFKNINKVYDNNVQAVFDFNLDIKDQEFIVLVGPSGCGKSTTLRMVAGLETITVGELYIDNVLVNNLESKDRNIAMVFQNYALYPHMTVYGNMAFALQLRQVPCPVYEEVPEVATLRLINLELIKKVKGLRKLAKKKNEPKELCEEIAELHGQILDNHEAMQALYQGKQRQGIYQDKIKEITKQIKFTEKEIAHFAKAKARGGYNEVSTKIIDAGLEQRKAQLQVFAEQLQHFQTTEVPLFKNRKLTKYEIEIEIIKAAKILDLEKYLLRKPAALSGGQRQRVALGRCLVRNPKVFLMDEPLSNLDAKLRSQTRNEIINIHKKVHATTIYVTHDQTEAMTMADRIVVMKDGYIQQIGDPDSIYLDPENMFVAGFIGNPAMNLFPARFDGKALHLTDQIAIPLPKAEQDLLKNYRDKEICVGLRPEEFFVKGDANLTKDHAMFPIKIEFIELLGYEKVVYTTINKKKLLAKLDRSQSFEIGDEIELGFKPSSLYFFDLETTKRIR